MRSRKKPRNTCELSQNRMKKKSPDLHLFPNFYLTKNFSQKVGKRAEQVCLQTDASVRFVIQKWCPITISEQNTTEDFSRSQNSKICGFVYEMFS